MLVDIVFVVGISLLVFLYQVSHTFCPQQPLFISFCINPDVGGVDDTSQGFAIGSLRSFLLNIADVQPVGTLQHVGGRGVFLVEVGLAAAGKNQQVGIVAGSVALDFLQTVDDRKCRVQGSSIFCVSAELAGKIAGRLGIIEQVVGIRRILCDLYGLLPIRLCQFALSHLVAGIALPVIALTIRNLSGLS